MDRICPYPDPYLQYLAVYHGVRDFFECHEIMEDYWKAQADTRHEASWLTLIRIAVASYHARRGNLSGARKMMAKALQELNPALMDELGLSGKALAARMQEALDRWTNEPEAEYIDIDLPIADPLLMQEAVRVCTESGWTWGMPSDQADYDVVNRHLTRDRSDVIEARQKAVERKQARKDSGS